MTETQTILKASDLRYGNWLKCGGNYGKVIHFEVRSTDDALSQVILENEGTNYWSRILDFENPNIEPIELTPEILEKVAHRAKVNKWYNEAGDEFITTDYFFESQTGVLQIRIVHGDILFWFKYNSDNRPRLMSDELVFYKDQHLFRKKEYCLHQLQNLYHSLTAEELEINL